MTQDPIVREIRKFRKNHSARYNNNLNKIFDALKEKEKNSKRKFENFGPKLILAKTGS